MKLYDDKRAPNPRRVRIFLAEKDIEVDTVNVDIMSEAHRNAENRALNPFEGVPFLVLDDGTVISETIAICRYFEELSSDKPLFGKTPLEKAQIEMWQRRAELGLFYTIAQAFRHSNPYMVELEKPQIAEWSQANLERIEGYLDKFEEALTHTPFVAGQGYSIADITTLVAIDFMRVLRLRLTDKHPKLLAWHALVSARSGSVK